VKTECTAKTDRCFYII